nr:hypothetical protein [Tanacetum cinerariifolium]
LENIIESQRSKNVKEGLGYNAVPPPAADLYLSPKKDLSWTGQPEFADDTKPAVRYAEMYRRTSKRKRVQRETTRPSPTVASTSSEDQNNDTSTSEDVASTKPSKPFVKFVKSKDSQPESPEFVLHKKPCFNCGDFSHLAKDDRRMVQRETNRSSGPRPHGNSMRPPFRPVGHKPHGPSMNPRRPTMNGARPHKTFFQTPSFETRPFLKSSAVNNSYRAP